MKTTYVLCTKETDKTFIETGKIAPCHKCGINLKISKPTLDRLKRFKEQPKPICQDCFKLVRDVKKSLRLAPPSKSELKALRKEIPDFNEEHFRTLEDDLLKGDET